MWPRLNVALIPSQEVQKAAISLSKKLNALSQGLFVLDEKGVFPHLTVYSPEYPAKNVIKVRKAVEEICSVCKPFELEFSEVLANDGYIVIGFANNTVISDFHEKVVEKLNPLREGRIREKYLSDEFLKSASNLEKSNIEKYGYRQVMELYSPHLSIIKFEDAAFAEKVKKEIAWDIERFRVNSVGVFEMGLHGTCVKMKNLFNIL